MSRNSRTSLALAALAALMLGAAFAAKPLYDTFCRVTGYGGTVQRSEAGPHATADRMVTVQFDANVAKGATVAFAPMQRRQTVRLGENGMAFYRVENPTDEPVTVVATFNVTPFKAGPYFRKIECFCFQEQHLGPGESAEMPVVYYVDAALADEPRLDDVRTITLSYTFFSSLEDAADVAASKSPGRAAGGAG